MTEEKLDKNFRGILGVYKPVGMTSHDVVNAIRKITGEKRVGHAGTLDPLAEGVLVVAVGREFTKKLAEFEGQDKEYVTEIKLGETSTTDDEEGKKKVNQVNRVIELIELKKVVKKFEGEIWQTPPLYSAVKVKGKEAYKYARKGQEVEMKPRKREVKEIEILDYKWPVVRLRVVTGKGVYIRSLARDIGEKLGAGGYMAGLVRTRVGEHNLFYATMIEDLKVSYYQDFTLVLPVRDGQVLLGLKKRGLGVDKWNGFGGKVTNNEGIEQAAQRELDEEVGIEAELEMRGRLLFLGIDNQVGVVWVFVAKEWEGEIKESEEMRPEWFAFNKVPYEQMWEDDRVWLPKVLRGEKVKGWFVFREDKMVAYGLGG